MPDPPDVSPFPVPASPISGVRSRRRNQPRRGGPWGGVGITSLLGRSLETQLICPIRGTVLVKGTAPVSMPAGWGALRPPRVQRGASEPQPFCVDPLLARLEGKGLLASGGH